jgi:SAM-dependent methyltransferase
MAESVKIIETASVAESVPTKIGPTTNNGPLSVRPGIGGGTSRSIQRRILDSRFATRYFVGDGLDVGGGPDSLALFHELFPLIRNIIIYDSPQGDAQKLANVDDESFNFLYSSHCLEHVRDPEEALANWIRVVRRGGHLVVSVPDEDLYEQGVWPSTFNTDHKITFTLCKKTSWSPVSVNLFDLIAKFSHVVKPLSITTNDHAYRFKLARFDQCWFPPCESAIEFVLKRL